MDSFATILLAISTLGMESALGMTFIMKIKQYITAFSAPLAEAKRE
jgi:hypothetical protein